MIAGRRTYADKFVELISTNELPYHFRDEQAHFTYAFTPTTRLSVTAYDGRDVLDANIAAFGDSTGANASGGTFLFDWGNTVAGATLTKLVAARRRARALAARRQHDARAASRRVSRFSTRLDLGAGSLTLANTVIDDARLAGSRSRRTRRRTSARSATTSRRITSTTTRVVAADGDVALRICTSARHRARCYFDDLWRRRHRGFWRPDCAARR